MSIHQLGQLPIFAPGGQKPFREKVSGLPKAFHYDGFYFPYFFVCLSAYFHNFLSYFLARN